MRLEVRERSVGLRRLRLLQVFEDESCLEHRFDDAPERSTVARDFDSILTLAPDAIVAFGFVVIGRGGVRAPDLRLLVFDDEVGGERVVAGDDEPSAGCQQAGELRHRGLPVLDVFERELADDEVEAFVVEGVEELSQVRHPERRRVPVAVGRLRDHLLARVHADNLGSSLGQPRRVVPRPAPRVENALAGHVWEHASDGRPLVLFAGRILRIRLGVSRRYLAVLLVCLAIVPHARCLSICRIISIFDRNVREVQRFR